MAATSTYSAPGISRSRDSGGGARDASVDVKERSCVRSADMKPLRRVSPADEYECSVRRARRIWLARREVGVVVVVVGAEEEEDEEGWPGGWGWERRGGRSS